MNHNMVHYLPPSHLSYFILIHLILYVTSFICHLQRAATLWYMLINTYFFSLRNKFTSLSTSYRSWPYSLLSGLLLKDLRVIIYTNWFDCTNFETSADGVLLCEMTQLSVGDEKSIELKVNESGNYYSGKSAEGEGYSPSSKR